MAAGGDEGASAYGSWAAPRAGHAAPAQSTAVVPPVIAAAKSTTSKTKGKKAFKPKVKKPKKNTKKTVAASMKK